MSVSPAHGEAEGRPRVEATEEVWPELVAWAEGPKLW